MDKFGIFKLLSSFYDYFSKNNQQKSSETPFSNNDNSLNGIESLFNSLKGGFKTSNADNLAESNPSKTDSFKDKLNSKPDSFKGETKENNKTKNSINPLNQQMLSTIRNHDEIIKRVKEKNNI